MRECKCGKIEDFHFVSNQYDNCYMKEQDELRQKAFDSLDKMVKRKKFFAYSFMIMGLILIISSIVFLVIKCV